MSALRHLCFLVERRWEPYPKWSGTAFADLSLAAVVGPALTTALAADTWRPREQVLCDAADAILDAQAAAGLPVAHPATHPFFDRPLRIANPDIVTALSAEITDPWLRRLPVGLGSLEQWSDNPDLLAHPTRRATTTATYLALTAP